MITMFRLPSSLISALSRTRRPSAVLGLVVSIWVYAVECISFRTPAHVCQEHLKRIAPDITYRDAASAVIDVVDGLIVKASLLHGSPSAILTSETAAPRCSVYDVSVSGELSPLASETDVAPAYQPVGDNDAPVSAIATAQPRNSALRSRLGHLSIRCAFNNNKPAESLVREIVHMDTFYGMPA